MLQPGEILPVPGRNAHQLQIDEHINRYIADLSRPGVAFDRRYRDQGVRATAVHPGTIHTELARHVDAGQIQKIIEQRNQQLAAEGKTAFQWKTIPQGAATSVWAGVVAPGGEIGGQYCEDCHVSKIVPDSVPIDAITEGVRQYALDPRNAEALWKKSEELVGESF